MVRLIRCRKSREFVRMGIPVEVSAVNDTAADSHRMAIHIFCRGVCHDICSPLERAAVNRSCERVVHDQRYAVFMRKAGKLLDIEND